VLGAFAVFRRRSLVGDALAHATLPGVAFAFLLTGSKDPAVLLAGAGCAGIVAALMMVGVERTSRIPPDAAIGVVLAGFFSLGIVLLTYISNQNDANQAGLEKYLFGQAAGLLQGDLELMAVLAAISLTLVVLSQRALKVTLFDPDFAGSLGLRVRALEVGMTAMLVVAVIIGVRTVGAILMVAMLIVPTVTARQLSGRLSRVLVLAGLVGAGVGATGALIANASAVPTGPVIVLVGLATVVTAILFAPGRGVAWRARALLGARRRSVTEAVLVDLETAIHAGPPLTEKELALGSGRGTRELRRALGDLDRAGMLRREDERLFLTEAGAAAAHSVLERRDLWSLWLEHGWRLQIPDAREPDPRDLRGSLGDEFADRLQAMGSRGVGGS
jgi:manganese/zinc/iron transport system permease protein